MLAQALHKVLNKVLTTMYVGRLKLSSVLHWCDGAAELKIKKPEFVLSSAK